MQCCRNKLLRERKKTISEMYKIHLDIKKIGGYFPATALFGCHFRETAKINGKYPGTALFGGRQFAFLPSLLPRSTPIPHPPWTTATE
jgi:hypothetical protein